MTTLRMTIKLIAVCNVWSMFIYLGALVAIHSTHRCSDGTYAPVMTWAKQKAREPVAELQ